MQQVPEALAPMAEYAQFILFKLIRRQGGRTDKVPVDHRTLQVFAAGADWQQDPTAWTTFANASNLAGLCGPDHGVGFFFTATDPFFFLDIDHCLANCDGQIIATALALEIMGRLPGAAVEVSQSGTGLHIFGKYSGPAPDHAKKNEDLGLELYTEKRFVALTGDRAIGSADVDCTANLAAVVATYYPPKQRQALGWTTEPVPEYTGPEDDDELIRRACATTSAASAFGAGKCGFKALWEADEDELIRCYPDEGAQARGYDASRADAALAQHLAFWTGKNCERIQALMLLSGLVREKWETHSSYLEMTIENAVAMQTSVYSIVKIDTSEAEAMGAPKLKGTPKQVEYAGQIRANKLAECAGDCEVIDQLIVKRGPVTEAKFWIDNQHTSPEDLAAMVKPIEVAGSKRGSVDGLEFTAGAQILGAEQQADHFKGCVYVQDAHKVLIPSGALLKPDQFNATYGGYDFDTKVGGNPTKKAFDAFTSSQLVRYPKAESTCFRPDLAPGALIDQNGQILVNTYVPLKIARIQGDVSPFLIHLAKVLPVESDQAILLAYMAACVQHPGVKFQWAPLIQGVEGNGKTLFTRCVAAAIGRKYTHLPKASEIGEKFNEWLFDKLFIGVEDVFVPDHKREIWEILKPMITGEWQPCRAMQRAEAMKECCSNFIFNANDMAALRKTENDRRVAPFFCAQQYKSDLARDGMTEGYFPKLYAWLRQDGYAIVAEYLHTYPIPDELNPALGHTAPQTSSTTQAITAGLGSVEQEVLEAIDEGRPGFAGGWISSAAFETLLRNMHKETAIPVNKRRDTIRGLGYDWHPALRDGRVNNAVMPDGKKPRLFIKAGHIHANLTSPKAVADAYEAAQRDAVNGNSAVTAAGVFQNG